MTREKEGRCPYCVADSDFHPMRLISNWRLICEKCGHIYFPERHSILVSVPEMSGN